MSHWALVAAIIYASRHVLAQVAKVGLITALSYAAVFFFFDGLLLWLLAILVYLMVAVFGGRYLGRTKGHLFDPAEAEIRNVYDRWKESREQ